MEMNDERWRYTQRYLKEVFGAQDDHLAGLMKAAVETGLPDIAVSPDVGRLLGLLSSMTRGDLAVEVGTLAGYSGIWIARGLAPTGRLITIEYDGGHAAFAKEQFKAAGLGDRIEMKIGRGVEVLTSLVDQLEPRSVDVLFFDADKREYPEYFRVARPLVAPGGLLIADNALGSGHWWIDDEANPYRAGAHELNLALARDPEFDAAAVPLREGLLIARRKAG
ncbi:MAG: O-methyltransferase [Myxococcota bacterium]